MLVAQAKTSSRIYQKVIRRVFAHWQDLEMLIRHVESWDAYSLRVQQAMSKAMQRATPGSNVLIVSSGGVASGTIDRGRATNDEPVTAGRQSPWLIRLDNEVNVVDLDRELNDSKIGSMGGPDGAAEGAKDFLGSQGGHTAARA